MNQLAGLTAIGASLVLGNPPNSGAPGGQEGCWKATHPDQTSCPREESSALPLPQGGMGPFPKVGTTSWAQSV